MSWKGVTVMDQRVRFISEYLNAYFPFIELCKQFEISRARSKHPTWGPKKLLEIVSAHHPDWDLPAISTTADLLKRKGLIPPGKRRLRRKHPGCPKTTTKVPNDIWTADYKGHFK